MDHETAWGLLDELSEGRLPPELQAGVRGHADGCPECRAQLEMLEWLRSPAVVQAGRRALDGHPSTEHLARFALTPRELDRESRAYLRRHLRSCRSCRDDVAAVRGAGATAGPWRMALEDFLDAPVRQWLPMLAPLAAGALAVVLIGVHAATVRLPEAQRELEAARARLAARAAPGAPTTAPASGVPEVVPPAPARAVVPGEPPGGARAEDVASLRGRVDSLRRLVAAAAGDQPPIESLVLGEEHAEPEGRTSAPEGLRASVQPSPDVVARVHVRRGQAVVPISITQLAVTLGLRSADAMQRPLVLRVSRVADGAEVLSRTVVPAEHWRADERALVLYAPAAALAGGDYRLEVLDDPGRRLLYAARFAVVAER